MIISSINEKRGHINISIEIDHFKFETYFHVTISLYSNGDFLGLYKKYTFKTYRAADNKMRFLAKKYNFGGC